MEAKHVERQSFGQENFGKAVLGDRRRTRRLVQLADVFLTRPGGSLPEKCGDPAMYQGLMGLVQCDQVTHAAVLAPHRARTLERMRSCDGQTLLIIHDITELDYTSRKSLAGQLGQIGDGGGHGYECFNSLVVVAETREALGLANQMLYRRPKVPKNESKAASRKRANRQSRLWPLAVEAISVAPANSQWVHLMDREGETFECQDAMHRTGKHYVIRSQFDRCIQLGHELTGEQRKLQEHVRTFGASGTRTIEVPARAGQASRTAVCGVSMAAVQLLPPKQPRGEHGRDPLKVWVVRVWELNSPPGAEPVEWILLTNVEVRDLTDANERADWYSCRWIIEEYHKAQKTGCGIEQPQFEFAERLEPVVALLSIVAVQLLQLRDASRHPDAANRSASELFAPIYVKVLSGWRHRGKRSDLTIHEFFFALARLGGHQNRRRDHRPGWLILWRGWTKLQAMVEGATCYEYARSD